MYVTNTFNWQLFRSFDAAARAFWADKPRASVLDLAPLYLRVEAHIGSPGTGKKTPQGPNGCRSGGVCVKDCLHMCTTSGGGPLRLVPRLLQRMLSLEQKMARS